MICSKPPDASTSSRPPWAGDENLFPFMVMSEIKYLTNSNYGPIWIQMGCGADLNSWLSLVSHALSHSMEILSYEVTISMGSRVVFRLEWPEV